MKRFAESSVVPNARLASISPFGASTPSAEGYKSQEGVRGLNSIRSRLELNAATSECKTCCVGSERVLKFILKRVLRVLNAHRVNSAQASRLVQVDRSRQTSSAHQYQNECLGLALPGVRVGLRAGGPKGPGGGRARHALDSPVVLYRN